MNSHRTIDLVGKRTLWYAISLAVTGIGMYFFFVHKINWGIDFTGGGIFRYQFSAQKVPPVNQQVNVINQVRTQLRQANLTTGTIQISGGDELYIRTRARDDAERQRESRTILDILQKEYPGVKELGSEVVGPVIGKDLTIKAILGVTLGCILIAIWIWIRYNAMGDGLRYAVAGIVALIHDVLVLVGTFALACKINPRIEADSSFVAALLTVVGYSINDTVVIYDRIRENLHLRRRDPYAVIVNDSLLQTMARSINTVLTVELTLIALFFFGGETIHSFILALIIGVTTGGYSSIFVAASLLVSWKAWDEKRKPALIPARKKEAQPAPATATPRFAPAPSRAATAPVPATTTASNDGEANAATQEKVAVTAGGSEEAKKKKAAAPKRGKRKKRF